MATSLNYIRSALLASESDRTLVSMVDAQLCAEQAFHLLRDDTESRRKDFTSCTPLVTEFSSVFEKLEQALYANNLNGMYPKPLDKT